MSCSSPSSLVSAVCHPAGAASGRSTSWKRHVPSGLRTHGESPSVDQRRAGIGKRPQGRAGLFTIGSDAGVVQGVAICEVTVADVAEIDRVRGTVVRWTYMLSVGGGGGSPPLLRCKHSSQVQALISGASTQIWDSDPGLTLGNMMTNSAYGRRKPGAIWSNNSSVPSSLPMGLVVRCRWANSFCCLLSRSAQPMGKWPCCMQRHS